MEPVRYNITVRQGSPYRRTLLLKQSNGAPVNLTGCSVRSQLRRSYFSSSHIDIPVTIESAPDGKIRIDIPSTTTKVIPYSFGVYDVELTMSNGDEEKVIYGNFTVTPEVTKDA